MFSLSDVLYIATSNDPWGPVGSDMADIAQMTYNKLDNQLSPAFFKISFQGGVV